MPLYAPGGGGTLSGTAGGSLFGTYPNPTLANGVVSDVNVSASAAIAFSKLSGVAAASHTHGNITNAGAIGTTANLPLITTTSGVVTTGAFGTAPNQFCQGNDSRLSDPRAPTAHTHTLTDLRTTDSANFTYFNISLAWPGITASALYLLNNTTSTDIDYVVLPSDVIMGNGGKTGTSATVQFRLVVTQQYGGDTTYEVYMGGPNTTITTGNQRRVPVAGVGGASTEVVTTDWTNYTTTTQEAQNFGVKAYRASAGQTAIKHILIQFRRQ